MRTGGHTNIVQRIPRLTLSRLLLLIRQADSTGRTTTTEQPQRLRGNGYALYYLPRVSKGADGRLLLSIRWVYDGEERAHVQEVPIIREESHLVPGTYVYYFTCPSGCKCKKLFHVGGRFLSRRAFPHRYYEQGRSRQQRATDSLTERQPYRNYGKEYYRGRLTPYGARCIRYEYRQLMAMEALCKGKDRYFNDL